MDREKQLLKLVWESEDLGDWVTGVAWDPSGSRLAVATASGRVDVLMYRDGVFERLLEMYLDLDELGGISWSPNGRYIAFGSNDAKLGIVDIEKRSVIYLDRADDVVWIESTSWCRDLVAVAGRNLLALYRFGTSVEKLWELKTKELWNIVKEMLGEDTDCVVLHHVLIRNDVVIAVGTYASECLRPLLLEVDNHGEVLKVLGSQHPKPESDDADFVCMDLDAEGMYVAIADYLRSRIAVRSADGFKELAETTVSRYPTSLTWIGRNVLAVGKAGGYVELYRFDGRYLKLLEEQKVARDTVSWSHGLSYSSRNQLLTVGSRDRHVYALACPRESSIEAIEQGVDSRRDRYGSKHDLKQLIEVLKRSGENVESTLASIWETSWLWLLKIINRSLQRTKELRNKGKVRKALTIAEEIVGASRKFKSYLLEYQQYSTIRGILEDADYLLKVLRIYYRTLCSKRRRG